MVNCTVYKKYFCIKTNRYLLPFWLYSWHFSVLEIKYNVVRLNVAGLLTAVVAQFALSHSWRQTSSDSAPHMLLFPKSSTKTSAQPSEETRWAFDRKATVAAVALGLQVSLSFLFHESWAMKDVRWAPEVWDHIENLGLRICCNLNLENFGILKNTKTFWEGVLTADK